MSDLLPCPFCGGSARMEKKIIRTDKTSTYCTVVCCNCHASTMWAKTKKIAKDAWNRRIN